MRFLIAPSLLAADIGHLADEIRRIEDADADLLHLDIMDGHFVPNLTFGPVVVEHVRKAATLPLDVHLMIEEPGRYAGAFREAGADNITFHPECVREPEIEKLLHEIRGTGATAGLSLRPDTPIETVYPYLDLVEMVMVMTVHPGFGGQKLIPHCLDKVEALRRHAGPGLDIQVDGGVNESTIKAVAEHGANVIVAGVGVFRAPDAAVAVAALREACERHSPWA